MMTDHDHDSQDSNDDHDDDDAERGEYDDHVNDTALQRSQLLPPSKPKPTLSCTARGPVHTDHITSVEKPTL